MNATAVAMAEPYMPQIGTRIKFKTRLVTKYKNKKKDWRPGKPI